MKAPSTRTVFGKPWQFTAFSRSRRARQSHADGPDEQGPRDEGRLQAGGVPPGRHRSACGLFAAGRRLRSRHALRQAVHAHPRVLRRGHAPARRRHHRAEQRGHAARPGRDHRRHRPGAVALHQPDHAALEEPRRAAGAGGIFQRARDQRTHQPLAPVPGVRGHHDLRGEEGPGGGTLGGLGGRRQQRGGLVDTRGGPVQVRPEDRLSRAAAASARAARLGAQRRRRGRRWWTTSARR